MFLVLGSLCTIHSVGEFSVCVSMAAGFSTTKAREFVMMAQFVCEELAVFVQSSTSAALVVHSVGHEC